MLIYWTNLISSVITSRVFLTIISENLFTLTHWKIHNFRSCYEAIILGNLGPAEAIIFYILLFPIFYYNSRMVKKVIYIELNSGNHRQEL